MSEKYIRIVLDSTAAKRNADALEDSVSGVGDAANKSQFSVNKLAAAIAGAITVDQVLKYADGWTKVENQLKRTTQTQTELYKTSADLLNLSNDTRSSLASTVDLYTSLTISTEKLGLSQKDVMGITRTINNLFLESGKGAEESANAIRQLGQALDAGALKGDEFIAISENAPGILRAIQLESGKTRKELREMASDGEITAEVLVKSLSGYSEVAQRAADKTRATWEQNQTIFENNLIAYVGASEAITTAVSTAGDSMVFLSENLESVSALATATAAIFVAKLIPGLVAYVASIGNVTRATLMQTTAVTGLSAALGMKAKAVTANTIAMNAASVAARGLAGAMAFLGGPLGVIFLAATAITYFATSSDNAAESADILSKSTDNLSKAQAENQKLQVGKLLDEENEKLERRSRIVKNYEGQLKSIISYGGQNSEAYKEINEKLIEARSAYDDASDSVKLLSIRLRELNEIGNNAPIDKIADDATKLALKLAAGIAEGRAIAANTNLFTGLGAQELREGNSTSGSAEIQAAKATTVALESELAYRRELNSINDQLVLAQLGSYYEKELALINAMEAEKVAELNRNRKDEQARRQADLAEKLKDLERENAEDDKKRQEKLERLLKNDKLTADQRLALKLETKAQERLADETLEAESALLRFEGQTQEQIAAQIHEEELNRIRKDGIENRKQLDILERKARIQSFGDMGNALLALGQGQSRKVFETGKALALAQAAVALPSSVMESYANGGGYPWGIPAAIAMGAIGLKNISDIKNAKFGSTPSSSASSPAPNSQGSTTETRGGPAGNFTLTGYDPNSLYTGEQLKGLGSALQDWWKSGGGDGNMIYQQAT